MGRKKRTQASPFTIGYVYVMTSPYQPNKVKIGYTTRSVSERAEQLTKRLGIDMKVEYFISRSHTKDLESTIHRFLHNYRCRFNGVGGAYSEEGFYITVKQAILIIDSIRNYKIPRTGDILPKGVNIEEYIKKISYDYNSNNQVHRDMKQEMKDFLIIIVILIIVIALVKK